MLTETGPREEIAGSLGCCWRGPGAGGEMLDPACVTASCSSAVVSAVVRFCPSCWRKVCVLLSDKSSSSLVSLVSLSMSMRFTTCRSTSFCLETCLKITLLLNES